MKDPSAVFTLRRCEKLLFFGKRISYELLYILFYEIENAKG